MEYRAKMIESPEPKRFWNSGPQGHIDGRIGSSKKGDLMSPASKLFHQIGDNAFRTAIKFGRHALIQGGYLRDTERSACRRIDRGERLLKFYQCHVHL